MINEINNDKQLIIAALKGEESAYNRLLNSYKSRIFSYVYRLVKNYHDAEEITFDTFVRCFKSLKSFDQTKTFSTWLYTIAHNLSIDFLRKNKINYDYLDERYSDIASNQDLTEDYENKEKMNKIDQALAQLAPIDREIMILFHKDEKSYDEISQILNIPTTTIKTRLHRARLKVRELLREK